MEFDIRKFSNEADNKSIAAGILPLSLDTGRFLLALRNEGKYSTIGGYLCWGEKPREGALREFNEETLYMGPLVMIKGFCYQNPVRNFEYINYIGIIPQEFKPILDKENIEADWFSLSQLYSGQLPLLNEFEHFLIESRPLIDCLISSFGFLNP